VRGRVQRDASAEQTRRHCAARSACVEEQRAAASPTVVPLTKAQYPRRTHLRWTPRHAPHHGHAGAENVSTDNDLLESGRPGSNRRPAMQIHSR
jgi:hypothetical protein